MIHRLPELQSLIKQAGVPEPDGFPIPAILAAIAKAESNGDPNAWVAHDPPSNPRAAPSSGLYQIHRPFWPEAYEQTELVRTNPSMRDREKIVEMTRLAKPVLIDALETAARASRILASRGFRVTPLQSALFMNATWQAGADNVIEWAKGTRTGDARMIVNPSRAVDVEVSLRQLAAGAIGVAPGAGLLLGVVAVFGVAALLVAAWDA